MQGRRIEDAGAFLPGAAKHFSEPTGSRIQQGRLLDELFPEPDWAARIASGLEPRTAAVLAMLYQGFSTSPMKEGAWQQSAASHRHFYLLCVQRMRVLFDAATNETLDQLAARFNELTGVPRNLKGLKIEQLLPYYALGRFGGKKLTSPFHMTTRATYLSKALPDLGWPQDCSGLKTGICHWFDERSQKYGVGKFMGSGFLEFSPPVLDRPEAIQEAKRRIGEELDENIRARRGVPKKGKSIELERSGGADIRHGSDVSAEDLMQRYRLRGIQFGESLSQVERQRWLNASYDALHDLSVVTGFEPQWLGLSKLGLALGARGRAGSAAHFEPSLRVINLTRMSGAGAAAHEWAHGLDNHLATFTFDLKRQGFDWIEYLSESSGVLVECVRRTGRNPEIAARMLHVQQFLAHDTSFRRAAIKIAGLKGARKDYWTQPREMFARGFEAAIQDLLHAEGISSPWLVYGTTTADLSPEAVADPYPQGEERRVMTKLVKELLTAIAAAARKSG